MDVIPDDPFLHSALISTFALFTVGDLRVALMAGKVTRAEVRKHVHIFITTEAYPAKASSLIAWGMRIASIFRHRWRIETGFRVSDGIPPSSQAR
jgi:hypothetical protein